MNIESADSIAERFPELDGCRLIDYRPVALPVMALRINAVVLERRAISVPVEYALRALALGLIEHHEVAGVLGLSKGYAEILLAHLEEEGYCATYDGTKLVLLPKGEHVLQSLEESNVKEREVQTLWDMGALQIISGYVEDLGTAKDAIANGLVRLSPARVRPPREEEIDLALLQESWRHAGRRKDEQDDEILKILKVREAKPRIRPAVALAYASEDRKDVRVQLVIDGSFDKDLAQNFSAFRWAEQMAVGQLPAQRINERNLRTRVFGVGDQAGLGSTPIMRRRAVVRFSMRNAIEAQSIQSTEQRAKKIGELQAELVQLEQQISGLGAIELLPYEMFSLFNELVNNAEHSVLLTTTLPVPSRCNELTIRALEAALKQGKKISIYLADRVRPLDQFARGSALRRLDDLVAKYSNLEVCFLVDTSRSFFEVLIDKNALLVANEPPLGERRIPDKFRLFAGVRVTDPTSISAYIARWLSDEQLQVATRITASSPRRANAGKGASKSVDKRTSSYRHRG